MDALLHELRDDHPRAVGQTERQVPEEDDRTSQLQVQSVRRHPGDVEGVEELHQELRGVIVGGIGTAINVWDIMPPPRVDR